MEITVNMPLGFSEPGHRDNNEDAFYPPPDNANTEDKLFIVCDGVGGAAKGEVASSNVCRVIPKYFQEHDVVISDKDTIGFAVGEAEKAIDDYLAQNHDAHGMATTLTLLHLHPKGATVAWCGDSRVYHIRKNEVVFKTTDHTHINNLLKAGVITPEEAKNHPDKNLITRAIQGASVKKAKVDVITLDDIQSGDLFFLCTDGVLEALGEEQLNDILADKNDIASKSDEIRSACHKHSKDNYTFYLIEIAGVNQKPHQRQNIPIARPATFNTTKKAREETVSRDTRKTKKTKGKTRSRNQIYLLVFALGVISFFGLFFLFPSDNENNAVFKTTDHDRTEENIAIETQQQIVEVLPETVEEEGVFSDDRDKKSYDIIRINETEWLSTNLEFNFEGSLEPHIENGGRYYTWTQAQHVCPEGWNLPSISWNVLFRDEGADFLGLVFSGHIMKGKVEKLNEEAMYWYVESDNGRPFYFSLNKGDNIPNRRTSSTEIYKPVRCVRNMIKPKKIEDNLE